MRNCVEELQTFLKGRIEEFSVVVMPDFFLDRLVNLDCNVKTFSEKIENVAKRKGGSIDGIKQTDLRGGNAVNTASALSRLGVRPIPIVSTDKLGLKMIKVHLKSNRIDLTHVKIFKETSITTAIEFETENGKVNVMLRNIGDLVNFGPHHLDEDDFKIIEKADYTCVFNWAGTRNFGTELAKTVFCHAKTRGKGKTYYDTADPIPNEKKIPQLIKNVLQSEYVDILSVNENEAICYASELNDEIRKRRTSSRIDELAKEAARILASHLSARIDLHTTDFSATFTENEETIVPAFQVPVLRATGSGDAWNAGNILGDAGKISDISRLVLANAVAAYYISNPNGVHPTRKQLTKFLEKPKWKNPS